MSIARVLAVVVLIAASSSAHAQAAAPYRNLAPGQLVQRWSVAPRQARPQVATAMAARRAEVLPVLRDMVRNGSRGEKMFACSMIGELRDRDSIDELIAASADADVRVRRRAATVLRILADRRAVRRLRQILRDESDLGVVRTALAALGRIGSSRDASRIEPFLTHDDHGTRVVAAGALAMLGDERGLEIVLLAGEADDPAVRKSATYALGFFAADIAGQRLREIVDDPDGAWKGYARIAQTERSLAGQTDAQQVATLGELAAGRSRTAAEWAVERLTDIGGAGAIAALRAVQDKETPVGAKAERRVLVLEAQP